MLKALAAPDDGYYVYELIGPSGNVFYVGKGSGYRVLVHEEDARAGCQCRKCEYIRAIWQAGGVVSKRVVFQTSDEEAAYHFERELIERYSVDLLTNANRGRGATPLPKQYTSGTTVHIATPTDEERAWMRLLSADEKLAALVAAARAKAERLGSAKGTDRGTIERV